MKDVGKLALMEKRADILDNLCVFATEGEEEEIAKTMVCSVLLQEISRWGHFLLYRVCNYKYTTCILKQLAEHFTGIEEVMLKSR